MARDNVAALTPEQMAAKEKQKKVLAGVLLALLAVVFYFNDPLGLFGSDTAASSSASAGKTPTPKPKVSPTPANGAKRGERVVDNPLNIFAINNKPTPVDGTGRNIFVYPTPTPPPPPPTPPPPGPPPPTPPIVLVGINPQGVIGKTEGQPLTVTALKFPEDARIFVDGREIATTYVDESHVKGALTAEMIRNPGNLGIQVRSAGDANKFSQQLSLSVAEPPAPAYRYVGLIVSKQGSVAVLKSQADDEIHNVKIGDVMGSSGQPKKWKVTGINADRIEILDTTINVPHVIKFTAE